MVFDVGLYSIFFLSLRAVDNNQKALCKKL